MNASPPTRHAFADAADVGFSPTASGVDNQRALQAAVDAGGTITVARPGTYALAGTVLLGSHTTLLFGAGVVIRKVDEAGPFSHVLLNKGALTRTWDEDIVVDGLHLEVNGLDHCSHVVFGLRGQVAFFHARDVAIRRFRCLDLGRMQYAIHVCTFEDLLVDDVIIHGQKDGVHLGRGRRFTIRNGVFGTADDAVALNAHDYDTGNPELGWIEHGVIENCHDLRQKKEIGFFIRILAGAWVDWRAGMEVQKSDTVVSAGRLYRVSAQADGRTYISRTRPEHATGRAVLDGITWVMVQDDVTYTAGVRHVALRDIFLAKPRTGMSIHLDCDAYSRSYYPGAPIPLQEQLSFDGIRVLHDEPTPFLCCNTPVDAVTIRGSTFRRNHIAFHSNGALADHGRTSINLVGNTFAMPGAMDLIRNEITGKRILLTATGNQALHDDFSARIDAGPGTVSIRGELPGRIHQAAS